MDKDYATKQEVKEIVREATTEIIEAIGVFSDRITKRVDDLESDMKVVKRDMVTKDYLDSKLAVVQANIILAVKGEDQKVNELIKHLVVKNVIAKEDGTRLLEMQPFPK